MWIIAAGMPRSGSTLQYQMACQVVERLGIGEGMNVNGKRNLILDKQMGSSSRWYVIKTHRQWDYTIQALPTAKVLYVYRDIRDVIASAMVKSEQSFREIMRGGLPDMAICEYMKWTTAPSVLVSRYENVYRSPAHEVCRIIDYLEINILYPTMMALGIAEYLSIENQIKRREERDGKPTRHISPTKGKPGQHKVILTPAEIVEVNKRYGGWLRGRGYLEAE